MRILGNLLKVSGVVDRLSKAAQNEIINIATLFLGLAIGATMSAAAFLNLDTDKIMVLGLIAFVLDTVAGLLFGKLMSVLSGGKINPLIGAGAFPLSPWRDVSLPKLPTMRTRITLSSCMPGTRIQPVN